MHSQWHTNAPSKFELGVATAEAKLIYLRQLQPVNNSRRLMAESFTPGGTNRLTGKHWGTKPHACPNARSIASVIELRQGRIADANYLKNSDVSVTIHNLAPSFRYKHIFSEIKKHLFIINLRKNHHVWSILLNRAINKKGSIDQIVSIMFAEHVNHYRSLW